ncbi:hypothetical protein SESBI_09512 [Sesbania bispinosa]|nr:hypothetical protein SESBI_09512 [Sesbania bispinosa]
MKMIYVPNSYVIEEVISDKMLKINIFQMTATSLNNMATNLIKIIFIEENLFLSHVNGAPHERVLANVPPQRAHLMCTRHNFNGTKPLE